MQRSRLLRSLTRIKPLHLSTQNARLLPPDVLVEEETRLDYRPEAYYPVKLGQIFHDKYEVITKLGYGGSSTVWLARDLRRYASRRHVVLKICTTDPRQGAESKHELEISQHVAQCNPNHPGLNYIRLVQDWFMVDATRDSHLCLVYQPTREPLYRFLVRTGGVVPSLLARYMLRYLLHALDYLHQNCQVIHTDLNLGNIMIALETSFRLEDLEEAELAEPSPRKILPDRTIYLSRKDWGPNKDTKGFKPLIADFDRAIRVAGSETFTHIIQPDAYRAPEVLLGVPWSYPVDIWNLGGVFWELIEGRSLFDGSDPRRNDEYTVQAHLAQIIDLIGPPPVELVRAGERSPMHFHHNGTWKANDCNVPHRVLSDLVTRLQGEKKDSFLNFLARMLCWDPKERATAAELLAHPYMNPTRQEVRETMAEEFDGLQV